MRTIIALFAIFLITSCGHEKKVKPEEELIGDWLILYPQHHLKSSAQRKIYPPIQDSIVGLLGLKTVSFHQDHSFFQTDSIFRNSGEWTLSPENKLAIRGSGIGFDKFSATMLSMRHDTLRLTEYIPVQNDTIEVIWHLKRIENDWQKKLFANEANLWRKTPTSPEDSMQIGIRVNAMLNYYSSYYAMLAVESAYFVQKRVFLPLIYYQHSMGLKEFDSTDTFCKFFFDNTQAKLAHSMIEAAHIRLQARPFPSGLNFLVEYGRYIEYLGDQVKRNLKLKS